MRLKRYFPAHSFVFFLTWLTFIFFGLLFTCLFIKGKENIILNNLHNPFLDSFFYCATFIGDGLFCFIIAVFFLFLSYKKAIWLMVSLLCSGLLTQLLKTIFSMPRPKLLLPDFNLLHQVTDVTIHTSRSFPSGHATSAFALAFVLTKFSKNHLTGFLLCLIGVIAGVSRIYLLQHFLIDVIVGSAIGVGVSLLVCWFLEKSKLNKKVWINHSLLQK